MSLKPHELKIFDDIDRTLDAVAKGVSDEDYMVFLSGIGLYLSHCCALMNDGRNVRGVSEELARNLVTNAVAMVAREKARADKELRT